MFSKNNLGNLIILLSLLFTCTVFGQEQWEFYEETYIPGSISGSIKHGHIFKTATGNFYEILDYVYLYEYEYSPNVIVLKSGDLYKLIIERFDESLLCRKLNKTEDTEDTNGKNDQSTPRAFGAYIVNDFEGFEQGNIYKLSNGQIWEQTEPYIWVWIWVMPKVFIWESNGLYKMKVEQIDHPVTVRRIK